MNCAIPKVWRGFSKPIRGIGGLEVREARVTDAVAPGVAGGLAGLGAGEEFALGGFLGLVVEVEGETG